MKSSDLDVLLRDCFGWSATSDLSRRCDSRLHRSPVDGGIKAQQIGRQKNFAYQKERAAGYGSPFLLVF